MDIIEKLKTLMRILGNVRLDTAVSWLEVKENAEHLRAEGHDTEPEEGSNS